MKEQWQVSRHALCRRQFHRGEHRLFIVRKNQGEDVCNLAIPAGLARDVSAG